MKIALGGVTFGREVDEQESFKLLDYAVERGITLIDTAEVYGADHASERVIGRWLRATGGRDRVVLQTKTLAARPDHVAKAIEGSLERLQTDRIDLYLLHRFHDDVPLADTMTAIAQAIRAGRIGAPGCSNLTTEQLKSALNVSPPFKVVQPPYSLVAREIEGEFLEVCKRENIAVITYSPLGAGFLTGKYDGTVPPGTRFDVIPGHRDIYFSDRNFDIVRRLRALSERVGVPMAKLALAWALRNPDMDAVLIGARRKEHIDNAIEALHMDAPEEWFTEMSSWTGHA
jgi:aryl-alcohol dehydrogenase-like predicted oxidoreductase